MHSGFDERQWSHFTLEKMSWYWMSLHLFVQIPLVYRMPNGWVCQLYVITSAKKVMFSSLFVCLSVSNFAIWWTLTKERQAWCRLQVKLCDPCLSDLCVPWCKKALYKYSSFHFPYCTQCDLDRRALSLCGIDPRLLIEVTKGRKLSKWSLYLRLWVITQQRLQQQGEILGIHESFNFETV